MFLLMFCLECEFKKIFYFRYFEDLLLNQKRWNLTRFKESKPVFFVFVVFGDFFYYCFKILKVRNFLQ